MSIFGYPSSGGGTQINAGVGLNSGSNPDGSVTLSVSGPFVVSASGSNIPQSVQLVAGNNVTFFNSGGVLTINAQATGGGAISTASYATVNSEPALANSRIVTNGNGITRVDGGAGGSITFGVASTITGATLLTLGSADTIFPNRSQIIAGSGISLVPGTNTVTIASTVTSTNGTVTSVGLTAPSWLTVSGSPITTAGTLSLTMASQTGNQGLFSPPGGGTPVFRAITIADLPSSVGTVQSVALSAPTDFVVSGSPVSTSGTLSLAYASQGANTFHAAPSGAAGIPIYRNIAAADISPVLGAGTGISIVPSNGVLTFNSTASSNPGTVTSVGLTTPSIFTPGAAVTSSGNLSFTLASEPQSTFLAAPTGGSGTPTFRPLVGTDILSGLTAGSNITLTVTGSSVTIASTASGGGGGTVSSVGLAMPSYYTVSGSPVTTSGTLTATLVAQLSGQALLAPLTSTGTPSFRNIYGQDLAAALTAGANVTLSVVGSSIVIASTASGGGGGTVTNVSTVNSANPFFNAPTTNSTTTPVITFTVLPAPSGTFAGGPTSGGSATPSYRAIVGSDIYGALQPGTGVTLVNTGSTVQINSTVTGGVTSVSATDSSLTISPTTGAVSAAVATNGVSNAKFRQSVGLSVVGNATNATANVSDIAASAGLQVLASNSGNTAIGFRSLTSADLPVGTGTVTSVGLALPTSVFNLSGTPVTTTGTLTGAFVSQPQSTIFAAPTGAAGVPTFRGIVGTDIYPALTAGSNVTLSVTGSSVTISSTASGGGGGSVTSFSSTATVGTLFTTTVATATTTPAQTITLTTAPSASVFAGPLSGVNATPAYRNLAATDFGTNIIDYLHGGTGISAVPTNGQLNIGNGSGFSRATLTQGTNITVTNASGSITISAAGSSNTNGTVTSVGLALPSSIFTVSGTPVTTTGTLTGTLATQPANTFLAGASSGVAAPTFRAIVGQDLGSVVAGSNITITPTGSTIVIASTASGGGGSSTPTTVTQSASATLLYTAPYLQQVSAPTGPIAITLYAANGGVRETMFARTDNSQYPIYIVAAGSDQIAGYGTTLTIPGSSVVNSVNQSVFGYSLKLTSNGTSLHFVS